MNKLGIVLAGSGIALLTLGIVLQFTGLPSKWEEQMRFPGVATLSPLSWGLSLALASLLVFRIDRLDVLLLLKSRKAIESSSGVNRYRLVVVCAVLFVLGIYFLRAALPAEQ